MNWHKPAVPVGTELYRAFELRAWAGQKYPALNQTRTGLGTNKA
jgi:hypothetical protein